MLISVQTPAAGGTAYAQFAAQWCQNGNGYLLNDTGTSLDVKIGSAASPITVANGKGIPFKLVYNCNELFVRRTDQATAQVTVEAQVGIEEVPSDGGGTSGPVAAADITDAGTAGIAVLQAETPAHGRTALGVGVLTPNAQAGSYILAAGDVNGETEIRQNSATGVNLTINADITTALNTPVFGKQVGAGQVTFVAGSGVTLRIPNSATKTAYQYSAWAAVQVSANVWEITGSLA